MHDDLQTKVELLTEENRLFKATISSLEERNGKLQQE